MLFFFLVCFLRSSAAVIFFLFRLGRSQEYMQNKETRVCILELNQMKLETRLQPFVCSEKLKVSDMLTHTQLKIRTFP